MRHAHYDQTARKKTVSLTVNSDLYAKVKLAGISASKVAEEALAQALAAQLTDKLKDEIRQDLSAYNAYAEAHGSPAELVRQFYRDRDDAV